MYRFLLTPKWIGWLLLATLFAVVCFFLGSWQLGRWEERKAENQKILQNYDASAVPLKEAVPSLDSFTETDEWRTVTVTGTYDAEHQLVVRNRVFNSQGGYEVIVPLKTADGSGFVIDRGWLPMSNSGGFAPDVVPKVPTGLVTVEARLRPGEPTLDRGAPAGQIPSIDLREISENVGYPLYTGAYGQLVTQNPPSDPLFTLWNKPSISEGSHLSYAMQWATFGILFFVAYGYTARMEYKRLHEDQDIEDNFDDYDDLDDDFFDEEEDEEELWKLPFLNNHKKDRESAEEAEDRQLAEQGF